MQGQGEEEEQVDLTKLVGKFAHLPISFIPLPCKPIFYDNALNDVDAMEESNEKNSSEKASSGGGVMGSLLSSFGWKQ